ncbi:FliH/SctL family protein [Terriglobus sp. RCC_193]|uniref:FliH/SctL family protein n=1 Tax=Terriglobus sp. RCC_193 TaxID=3239218 RepID=UPI0035256E18
MIWDDKAGCDPKVEPLAFRNVQEGVAASEVAMAMEPTVVADPIPSLDQTLREAHERGRSEAMESLKAEMEQKVAAERAAVSRMVQQFEEEKKRYFTEVESEVVRLSLAIAERVLHREAAMDPTLLAGAARVALEQVADGSEAVLRVAAEEAQCWNEMLEKVATAVQIEPDEHMTKGEAVLKTRSGSVQLGLKAQLAEIERGFFELLRCRPAMVV